MRIKIINLCKDFGTGFAIKNFNLTINEQCFLTFLGPSGCGKTTILRMIAGLEVPDSGEIWFDDKCIFSDKERINVLPEKRGLGFVFQDFALWPHMTVFENVAFGLRAKKQQKGLEKNVMDTLKAVQLEEFAKRYPNQLSGGQQQRVAFARAIVGNPGCILFDEPLSALDAILREEMRVEIKRLVTKLGVSAIFVTHDQLEAMTMSDSIVVMNKGKIEQQAEPEELYRCPQTPFVAKFIGKSNWINENEMFRPEQILFFPETDCMKFHTHVESVQFLGSNYELGLNAGKRRWQAKSPIRYAIGDKVAVYIQEKNIISIGNEG